MFLAPSRDGPLELAGSTSAAPFVGPGAQWATLPVWRFRVTILVLL